MVRSLVFLCIIFSTFASAQVVTPKFSWPTSGKVSVKEKVLKDGNRVVMSYDLNVKPDGDKLRIRYSDYQFLIFNGSPASAPELQDLKKIEKITAKGLPEFVVTRDGHFVGLGNIDAIIDMTASVAKDKESVKKVFAAPEARRALSVKGGEIWFDWTEIWSAVSIQDGKAVMNAPTGFMLFDSFNPAAAKVEFLGKCSRSTNCMELSLTMNLSGSDGAAMIQKGIQNISAGMNAPNSAAIQKVIKTKIDYNTLQPFEVSVQTKTKISLDKKNTEKVEEHLYIFDWSK